ncbi:MAG TPA: sugar ABC transporter permease [Chloroflexota bacterium]|nr:sugar ABC transporter permease [Chloroflexota bacterium]
MSSVSVPASRRRTGLLRREAIDGYLFIAPWLIGFIIWIAGPMLFSLALVFLNWSLLSPPSFAGFSNFGTLFSDDLIPTTLYNTAYYTFIFVPLHVTLALLAALALNLRIRVVGVFRTIYYLPSITPTVASAMLWLWIFNPDFGLVNLLLRKVHLPTSQWFVDPTWAKPAFIIMALWALGGAMIIFLAGLQNIPQELYEAASIDGADFWSRFWGVTLPMLSPVIFFNLVVGIIGSFQIFTTVFIISNGQGGPSNSTLFLVLYLYQNGFVFFKMGYASLIAWVLFLIVLIFTGIQFLAAKKWVHYEGLTSG